MGQIRRGHKSPSLINNDGFDFDGGSQIFNNGWDFYLANWPL